MIQAELKSVRNVLLSLPTRAFPLVATTWAPPTTSSRTQLAPATLPTLIRVVPKFLTYSSPENR